MNHNQNIVRNTKNHALVSHSSAYELRTASGRSSLGVESLDSRARAGISVNTGANFKDVLPYILRHIGRYVGEGYTQLVIPFLVPLPREVVHAHARLATNI